MFSSEHFARALRALRIEKGMTQNTLAQKLCVTTQLISKWERGEGMPGLENLCALARLFSVTVDALLRERSLSERSFIGIYWGNLIHFVLVSERGVVLNSIELEGDIVGFRGSNALAELLCQGIDYLHPRTMNVQAVFCIEIGEAASNVEYELVWATMKKRYPDIRFGAESAVRVLWECGGAPAEKTLAIVGGRTCCVAYWSDGETFVRTGRGGYLGRPTGSRYNIGHDALMAVCEAQDEVGQATALTAILQSWLGGEHIKSYLRAIAKRGPGYIACFAPLVSLAAARGDEVAGRILRDNSACLARLIQNAHARTPQADHVVLSNSLFTAENELFYRTLTEQLDPRLTVVQLNEPMVWEACRRAAALCQADGQLSLEQFLTSIQSNSETIFEPDD